MDIDRKFKRVIKTIYPGWIDERGKAHYNDQTLFAKLILVSDSIKRPSKNPTILFDQIKNEKQQTLSLLSKKLSSKEFIKDFKNKVKDPNKKYSEEIKLIKKCEDFEITPIQKKQINKLAEVLKKPNNWYDLIELWLDIDEIIPYEIKVMGPELESKYLPYTEDLSRIWYFAIYYSPLFVLRNSIADQIREIKDEKIIELYEKMLSLNDILDIMLNYSNQYEQATKKRKFNWKIFFWIIIVGYIILEALSIIEWNNLFIVPVIIVYIILSWLLDK